MKLVLVTAYFNDSSGYWEPVLATEAGAVHDVHVITSDAEFFKNTQVLDQSKFNRTQETQRYKVHRLPAMFEFRSRVVARGVSEELAKIQPDQIIVGTPSQLFSLAAVRWAKRNHTPYTYISGEMADLRPKNKYARGLANVYWSSIGKNIIAYTLDGAKNVITYTDETRDYLKKASHREDIKLVSLPVDKRIFTFDLDTREKIRHQHEWQDKFVILFAGKFERRKNLPDFVETVHEMKEKDIILILVGANSSEESETIKAEISKYTDVSIQIKNFTTQQELSNLYQACDLAFFPTASIGIQQALSTGIRVLTPSMRATTHIVEALPKGVIIVYDKDSESLDYKIREIYNNAKSQPLDRAMICRESSYLASETFLQAIIGE